MARVRIKVVDEETKRPLPWTKVQLGRLKAITDERGLVEFEDVGPGTYVLRIRSGTHRPFTGEVEIADGENELTITLTCALLGPWEALMLRPGDVVGPEVYRELIEELKQMRGG